MTTSSDYKVIEALKMEQAKKDLLSLVLADSQVSLRDRMAMAALTGLLADSTLSGRGEWFANSAYMYADAMLKAREEKKVSPDAE